MLEEMPPFPERESTILAKLKKKKGAAAVIEKDVHELKPPTARPSHAPNGPVTIAQIAASEESRAAEGSLISVAAPAQSMAPAMNDILRDTFTVQQPPAAPVVNATVPANGPLSSPAIEESWKRYVN